MTAAAYVNGFLVTHAGLTQRWREENLYGCDDARACASRINELFLGEDPHDWKMLASAGRSRGGYGVPGPLWADAADLYMDEAHGIDQIIATRPSPRARGLTSSARKSGCATRCRSRRT